MRYTFQHIAQLGLPVCGNEWVGVQATEVTPSHLTMTVSGLLMTHDMSDTKSNLLGYAPHLYVYPTDCTRTYTSTVRQILPSGLTSATVGDHDEQLHIHEQH